MKVSLLHDYLIHANQVFPHNIAIVDHNDNITYSVLHDRVNHFASFIQLTAKQKNIPLRRIAIIGNKSIASIISMLAALKLGCSYTVINDELPALGISEVLEILNLDILIMTMMSKKLQQQLAQLSYNPCCTINLGPDLQSTITQNTVNFPNDYMAKYHDIAIPVTATAYILFTSGSTGTPKGVCMAHQSAVAAIEHYAHDIKLNANDRIGNSAPLCFDLSMLDIFSAMRSGASLYLIDKSHLTPDRFFAYLNQNKISSLLTVPSLLNYMQENKTKPTLLNAMRYLSFSGEPLSPSFLESVLTILPESTSIWNLYGATEMPYVFSKKIHRKNLSTCNHFPPNNYITTRIDRFKQLHIKSEMVLSGYLTKKDTQLVFPFDDEGWYQTGDRASINKNNEFELHGRIDRQIKYMGHRIELDEIENKISHLAGVKEVAVLYIKESSCIIVFVVINYVSANNSIKKLADLCRTILPTHMNPKNFYIIDYLPKTITGKKDRRQLTNIYQQYNKGIVTEDVKIDATT